MFKCFLLFLWIILFDHCYNIHSLKVYSHYNHQSIYHNHLNTFYDYIKVSNNWNALKKSYSALYNSNYDISASNNSFTIDINNNNIGNNYVDNAKKEYICQVCSNRFLSRNKLFQHFYHSECTTKLITTGLNNTNYAAMNNRSQQQYDYDRQSIQITIGYDSRINNQDLNEIIAHAIHRINHHQGEGQHHMSISRASSNSFRKSVYLLQDMNVNAIGDVIIYSEPISVHHHKSISQWILEVNQDLISNGYDNIVILSKAIIPKHVKLHAEQHCTSRIYTFLLPLSILTINNPLSIAMNSISTSTTSSLLSDDDVTTTTIGLDSCLVVNRQVKAILKAIIGPKLAVKGGYRWRKGKEQQELRSIRRWHNYYRPYHTRESSTGNDNTWTPIVSSTDRVVLRTLDRLYAEGISNITIVQNYNSSSINSISPDLRNNAVVTVVDNIDCIKEVVVDHVDLTVGKSVIAMLPLKLIGDGFLTGQVRSIVGLLVAVYHGWLPMDFIEYSQRPDIITEVPSIPPYFNLMLLSESRFDWHAPFIDNINTTLVNYSIEFRHKIYQEIAKEAIEREKLQEYSRWLVELRDLICPRILEQYEKSLTLNYNLKDNNLYYNSKNINLTNNDFHSSNQQLLTKQDNNNSNSNNNISNSNSKVSEVPDIYHRVLSLLRKADASGLWPTTTKARQRVIKTTALSSDSPTLIDHAHNNEYEKVGSFSVGRPVQSKNTPRGNIIFEELVEAVFELEKLLIHNTIPPTISNTIVCNTTTTATVSTGISGMRKLSRMAAINRRAQFLPHKDAGAGFGQSQSLIVGLGDYLGGELSVEGNIYDIRYRPLEFDGWKQMHWTLPFQGERYSIVWFTPADSEDYKDSNNI